MAQESSTNTQSEMIAPIYLAADESFSGLSKSPSTAVLIIMSVVLIALLAFVALFSSSFESNTSNRVTGASVNDATSR
jgi:hypothetical protein